jgi:peptidoglycan hydrolase-like protein with peptidoglycan-binding domain
VRRRAYRWEDINNAEWRGKSGSTPTALLVKLQALLDRAHASPGRIDATRDENTRKAVTAYREMQGLPGGEKIDEQRGENLPKMIGSLC